MAFFLKNALPEMSLNRYQRVEILCMSDSTIGVMVPGSPLGMTTPQRLEEVAAVARKYKVETIKITASQRLKLYGVDKEAAPALLEELGGQMPKAVGVKKGAHTVQSCPGKKSCKYACQDSVDLSGKLAAAMGDRVYPGKVKVGVSGCSFNCCEGYLRDVGIFGRKSGWTLVFGGNAGGRPRIGDVIGEGLSDDEVIALTLKALDYYIENGKKLERSARLVTRKGVEELQAYIAA